MGIHYSYELVAGTVTKRLATQRNQALVLCDLQFEDEHGHALAPVHNALVALSAEDGGCAEFLRHPEDWLDLRVATDEDWKQVQEWIDASNTPTYDFHEEEEAYKLLASQPVGSL